MAEADVIGPITDIGTHGAVEVAGKPELLGEPFGRFAVSNTAISFSILLLALRLRVGIVFLAIATHIALTARQRGAENDGRDA